MAGSARAAETTASSVDLEARAQPRQQRAQARREAILQATLDLLVGREVADISTSLVAAEAGVPVGSVYRYFPNKFAILTELARRAMDLVDSRLEALMGGGPEEMGAAVDRGIDTILEIYRRDPAPRRLFRAVRTTPELAEVLRASNERMVQALLAALGRMRPDLPALRVEAAARTTVQIYTHLEALAIECEDPALYGLLVEEWKRAARSYLAAVLAGG
ncbi:MAG TPA: TetR/AcrR family transcriptional regulator [Azospirillaceae bacterium]|nr:TetR/AcrR family transcriptional regulator [Azospirillaceae bacterium]